MKLSYTYNAEGFRKRYEIVLLEDDPETMDLISAKLESRDIKVYPFAKGNLALQKITNDVNIGAFLTDIDILDPYPDGPHTGLQGYEVANKLITDSRTRLISIIVLTQLEQDKALDKQNLFKGKIYNFSKYKWLKYPPDSIQREEIFDKLADIVKERIEMTPFRWCEQVAYSYPESRWIKAKEKNKKNYPPYLVVYSKIWMSKEWGEIEEDLSTRANKIVQSYLNGNRMRLQGDHLILSENPNESSFRETLIARRVVYALKKIEPDYWESLLKGKELEEEETVELTSEIYGNIKSNKILELINFINKIKAENEFLESYEKYFQLDLNIKKLEDKNKISEKELKTLQHYQREFAVLNKKLRYVKDKVQPQIKELTELLESETQEIQEGFISFLRFFDSEFTNVQWVKIKKKSIGGQDPLQQTLRILGIRKEDIANKDSKNWKLLLPEERCWLLKVLE